MEVPSMIAEFRSTSLYFKVQWQDSVYFRCSGYEKYSGYRNRLYYVDNGKIQRYTVNTDEEGKYEEGVTPELQLEDFFDIKNEPAKGYTKTLLELDELEKILSAVLVPVRAGTSLEVIEYAFLEEVLIAEYVKKMAVIQDKDELLNDADRFIIKVAKPIIERETNNFNENTFDFIRVEVYLPANPCVTKDDIRDGVKKHYREICKKSLEKIEYDRNYLKYGVPINILSLSKMVISYKAKSVELLFEPKKIGNNGGVISTLE